MIAVDPISDINPFRQGECGSLQAGIISVSAYPWAEGRVGKCYINVKEMIRRHGGGLCYGWALTDFGPIRRSSRHDPPPLYRRWINHVVWQDHDGRLWEVTPIAVIDDHSQSTFTSTDFLPDSQATFDIVSDEEWLTRPSRYVALRPEGVSVARLLTHAQHATGDIRNSYLQQALEALRPAGFQPREWKGEFIGERTGSLWLIAD